MNEAFCTVGRLGISFWLWQLSSFRSMFSENDCYWFSVIVLCGEVNNDQKTYLERCLLFSPQEHRANGPALTNPTSPKYFPAKPYSLAYRDTPSRGFSGAPGET